jgi:hypothetical protein
MLAATCNKEKSAKIFVWMENFVPASWWATQTLTQENLEVLGVM